MNILILREEELYFFLPPTSTQRRPDEEQDDVANFAFEVLFYNNILQQPLRAKQHIERSKGETIWLHERVLIGLIFYAEGARAFG